jgi:hypothetical protein
MGTTSRFGLRYPGLADAPNGPQLAQFLAEDVDAWLTRAFPCPDANAVPTGVPDGFLIDRQDLGEVQIRRGGAWAVISPTVSSGGGSGAIGTMSATYAATTAQPISTASDVTVAFAVEQVSSPAVTRAPAGAGHAFTLTQTRLWTISATLRFAAHPTGGRTFELRAGSLVLAKASGPVDTDAPFTANLCVTRRLTAGTVITAIARHNAGTGIALEPNAGNYVHIDLAGV